MKVLRVAGTVLALFALTSALAFAHDTTISLTEENGSGQNGTAVLSDMEDGTTKVTIDISGGSAVAQPAHIHAGHCGPTLNPSPAYPLTSVVNGKSETVVPVDIHDLTGGTFAINIHKSAAEASVYVSCGNIVVTEHHEEGTPGMPTTGSADMFPLGLLALLGLTLMGGGLALSRRKA